MKKLFLTIIFSFLLIGNVFCQNEKKRNWSAEIGGVYNQWHLIYNFNQNIDTTVFGRWSKFHVMPTLRINRQFKISEAIYLKPFIGASVNGTQSDISFLDEPENIDSFTIISNFTSNIAYAYYYMPQVEVGCFTDFPFGKWNLQLGIKAQYHLTLWTNHKRQILPEPLTMATLKDIKYQKYQLDNLYQRFNMDMGMRCQYNFNRFLIAFEGWYGILDITPSNPSTIDATIHTTNIRLMFGYKF